MRNIVIVQARTGSTRLPRKVLLPLMDKTVLEHVLDRVNEAKTVSDTVVATTIEVADMEIVRLCAKNNVRVFCGSQDDVLDRYYQVAKLLKPDNVVRITADCPLTDYQLIDKVVNEHIHGNYDYTSNTIGETYPDGLDVEVMKFAVLKESWAEAKLSSQREHVTQYIIKSDKYKKGSIDSDINYGEKRWTLDTEDDYMFIKEIYNKLYKKNAMFVMEDVLKLLEQEPEIEHINHHIDRNEGLKQSLDNDFEIFQY